MVVHRRARRQADRLADLAHARWIVADPGDIPDVVQDLGLPISQLLIHVCFLVESETVTVQAGDTLGSLAQRRYPNEDVRGRVAEIERENGLADPVLHTGQTLRLRSP